MWHTVEASRTKGVGVGDGVLDKKVCRLVYGRNSSRSAICTHVRPRGDFLCGLTQERVDALQAEVPEPVAAFRKDPGGCEARKR